MSDEAYLLISQIAKLLPGRPNASTIWRWCKKGIKNPMGERVKLEHTIAGGRIVVSHRAVRAFLKAIQ